MTTLDEPRSTRTADARTTLLDIVRTLADESRAGEANGDAAAPHGSPVQVTLDTQFERRLGFDSLVRAELLTRIEAAFGTHLPVDAFASARTPADVLGALAGAPEAFEESLRAVVESGTALEVNTSGLRHDAGETYPAPWVVAWYRELGGERVTIGSDAHRKNHFAFGLAAGYRVAARARIGELAFRRGGDKITVALPPRFRPGAAA